MNIILLALTTCLVVVTLGFIIQKFFRMPWMFTVVILGMAFSALGWFGETMAGDKFQFLARMGMLFFLFTIGMDLEFKQIRTLGKYIVGGNILLTLTEGLLLALFFFFAFPDFVSNSFWVALIAGIAFGTVGEVILLVLLKEFGLEKTRFGQLAMGIGVFDDIFEVLILAIVIALPAVNIATTGESVWKNSLDIVLVLISILLATFLLAKAGKLTRPLLAKLSAKSFVIPFLIFLIIYAYIYFGANGVPNMDVIAAIFSGIAVQRLLPEKSVQKYKQPVYFVGNIFLGPFFFLSLGGKMSFSAVLQYPFLILIIIAISLFTRLTISYLLFHKLLGKKQSLVMGVGLTSKFSTSVVSENLLYTSGLIALPLYTIIMGAFIILKPIIVGVFARALATTKDTIQ